MTEKVTQISAEELQPVVEARGKAVELAQIASNAAAETEKLVKNAQVAELEYKVSVQQLFIAKGLDGNCRVDVNTGSVSWPEVEATEPVDEAPTKSPKRTKKATSK